MSSPSLDESVLLPTNGTASFADGVPLVHSGAQLSVEPGARSHSGKVVVKS